jgi:site-specific DNA recombinase
MRCVIYLRVSTREQAEEGYSIPAQREACLKYIRDAGFTFVDEYSDRGESARSQDRPQLQEMLARITREKDVQTVVVHKIDRLARNMEDHVAIKTILKRAGAGLVSVVENIEDSASGRLVEGIHALMAEFYSANLAAEVRKGMLQKIKAGGCVFRAPVGYCNVRETIGGRNVARVIIDEASAPLVHLAFSLYATGNYSLRQVTGILDKRGLRRQSSKHKPPTALTLSAVAKVLVNKFYTGVITYQGVDYPGEHEAIVDQELFRRVGEVLTARDAAGERVRKHPHYLKGTLRCAECGSRLSFTLAKGRYPYFFCLGQKRGVGCHEIYANVDEIESAVEDLYREIHLTPEAADKLRMRLTAELASRTKSSLSERRTLTRCIEKLSGEQYKLLRAYYEEAIPLEMMKAEQTRLSAEIMLAEERLVSLDAHATSAEQVLERALQLAMNCHEAYDKAKPETRRLFNQAFFEAIYVKDGKLQRAQMTELFEALFEREGSHKESLVEARRIELRSTATS